MSDYYLEMTLEQLQKEHAELLAFNENLDRERNKYRNRARKYARKVYAIESLFVVPSDDHELTLKAIKTIVERVGIMKDQNDNKTQDWCEVAMPLEVAQAALAAINKVFLDWDVLNEEPPECLKHMQDLTHYVERAGGAA